MVWLKRRVLVAQIKNGWKCLIFLKKQRKISQISDRNIHCCYSNCSPMFGHPWSSGHPVPGYHQLVKIQHVSFCLYLTKISVFSYILNNIHHKNTEEFSWSCFPPTIEARVNRWVRVWFCFTERKIRLHFIGPLAVTNDPHLLQEMYKEQWVFIRV